MHPAVRSQADDLQDNYSLQTGLDFSDVDPLTRQEFKDEADINILLARFGVNQQMRQPIYGTTTDYNMDLQQAMSAIEAAKRADFNVPEELRERYPNWRAVLDGAESGQYQQDLENLAIIKAQDSRKAEQEKALAAEKAALARRQRAERELKREREDLTGTEDNP